MVYPIASSPQPFSRRKYLPIEDHGFIGDMHTAALVGVNGTIDWFCYPHFDSPSVFAAILDAYQGGYFTICPADEDGHRVRQMYHADTNILITRFLSPNGVGEIQDFMPVDPASEMQRAHRLVRRVRATRGTVSFRMLCAPAFDYARAAHTTRIHDGQHATFHTNALSLALISQQPLRPFDPGHGMSQGVCAEFTLREGEEASFVLQHAGEDGSPGQTLSAGDIEQLYQQTLSYWRRWIARCTYRGRWQEVVRRSALALKLMTFEPTGALIAAPTTSLPESIGHGRNWDYRYTWIRDASFTLFALLRIGFTEEAARFMDWIEARCREIGPDGSLHVLYGIDGRHDLREETLDHLEGYRGSRPVRIGNGAAEQLQLDIYGELMDAIFLYNRDATPISYDLWDNLRRQLAWLARHWQEPDDGLWEVRGGRRQFTYSKMMCWVAFDRALRIAYTRGLPVDWDTLEQARDAIFAQVMEQGWNAEKKAFTQYYGSTALDAGLLLMPVVKFLGPTDPRVLGTIAAIERELVADSLVYRYDPSEAAPDGLGGREGTFSLCTFWFVEALTRAGRLDDARLILEKMFSYANHLGLYAEQIGPSGEALGNFPQAFTHLALITAIYNYNRAVEHSSSWRGAH
jgi:GH15 family glucan-1,4-alpha-glucosidase